MHKIWIINGIPGSGKTTTARRFAQHFARSVHIEGDKLQDFIISGNVPPGGEPKSDEARQIHLNVRNQCLLARSFSEAGFTPVIDYVLTSRSRLDEYREQLKGLGVYLVTLNPGAQVALDRDRQRPEKTVAAQWVHLESQIHSQLCNIGLWIDNSKLSIDQTVQAILAGTEKAKVN